MSIITHAAVWRDRFRVASVVLALVLGVAMLAGTVIEYRRYLLCHAVKEDCDMLIVAVWPILTTVAVALVAASLSALLWRTAWPLILVWTALCVIPLGIDMCLFVPAIRESWGVPETAQFYPIALICSPFLALAMLGLLPAYEEVRQEASAPR
ncbi:MAG TPA: hypothetical protein VMF58_17805 [Rhizomicrobium sp.]|nr:hypothetical protein [Rhizomicrobium sp.]